MEAKEAGWEGSAGGREELERLAARHNLEQVGLQHHTMPGTPGASSASQAWEIATECQNCP